MLHERQWVAEVMDGERDGRLKTDSGEVRDYLNGR